MKSIESAVSFMETIARDDSHGYDQSTRTGGIEYDCSSLVSKALNQADFNVKLGSTTRNLYEQLIACGFKVVTGTRKRGDILLTVGKHTAMCTDSSHIVHARVNEKGTATGGKSGDQTGNEICISTYTSYKGKWDYLLRYEELQIKEIAEQLVEKTCKAKSRLYIRNKASINGTIIGYFNNGEKATVNLSKSTTNWYRVHNATTGVDGYSSKKYLQ